VAATAAELSHRGRAVRARDGPNADLQSIILADLQSIGRPRGQSAPKFSGCVGRLNVERRADKGRSSLPHASRHSSPWEPPQKRLILLLPRVRRCHPALPRDCLGSFGGRRGALLGHFGNVLLFFGVGKPGRLLLADVSRQRRQVLSFQEVKISERRLPSRRGSRGQELCQVLP